ncbi:Ribonuclease T2-like [Carpediemonas membranifera]|uniref:Ribonuclease T2-like n=1 Tax=Carpediemonas membranifera TaxID=201153 RepID=A0A8J6AWB4_9EUKA|nr:Ribonuclease T2-like [Carpediemonas membranifera]|eukprot:KAG9395803.1 Ribonuclease T2-like [Carpediemonas membranifera]
MRVLVAFLLFAAILCKHHTDHCSNEDYDVIILVGFAAADQTSISSQTHLPKGVDAFSIHGFWPTVSNPKVHCPGNCGGPGFSESKIEDLKPELEKLWPTYMSRGDESFHQHEYEKHGRCAIHGKAGAGTDHAITDERSYFTVVMDLFKNLDYENTLAKEGVTPSTTKTYELNDILNALHYGTGKLCTIGCGRGNDGKTYLNTITACFDNNLEQVSCSLERVHYDTWKCQGDIHYLPMP